jgi:predicted Zn-dependent peptidase
VRVVLLLLAIFISLFGDDPYKNLTHFTLENGLKVYLLPDTKAKNVSATMEVGVGMGVESREKAGISHLVEHIVFRDSKIKDRDFYNLIKDKGATYVNGYTSYYKTEYVATIKPSLAYWLIETYSKMLFDKNVTKEDLRVERGALQVEIGEPTWVDKIFPDSYTLYKKFKGLEKIFPPNSSDVYESDFKIDRDKEKMDHYYGASVYKYNNKKFTLKEVLDHFHDYYYPSNMTLKVVGKFDVDKMKETIERAFGDKRKREGKTIKRPLIKDAELSDTPFEIYRGGMDESSSIAFGAKLLQDDPKKMVALKAYLDNFADRLGKIFRNKQGETYGVSGYVTTYRNAAIALISFSSPHEAFDRNVKKAFEMLKSESNGDINETVINEAIKQKRNEYDAVEHDVESLMDSVENFIEYKRYFGSETKTPYTLLNEITPDYMKKVLHEIFTEKNGYLSIDRDYLLFPYEGVVLSMVIIFLSILFILKFFRGDIKGIGRIRKKYRLTNILIAIFTIFLAVFIAELILSWLIYFIAKITPLDPKWVEGYDIPISYLLMIVDAVLSLVISYFVIKKLFSWYHGKLFVGEDRMIISGPKSKKIDFKDIKDIEIAPYSLKRKPIYGNALLFWRPLVEVTLNNGEKFYLRSFRAAHLRDDLKNFIK